MIIILEPKNIEISIAVSISIEWTDFVADYVATIRKGRGVPGRLDTTSYIWLISIVQNTNTKCWLVKCIAGYHVHAINDTSVCLVKKWAYLAGKAFP